MTNETSTVTAPPPMSAVPTLSTERRRPGSFRVTSVVSQILLSLVALLFLVPIIWMLLSALKPSAEVFTDPAEAVRVRGQVQQLRRGLELPAVRPVHPEHRVRRRGRHLDHVGGVRDVRVRVRTA